METREKVLDRMLPGDVIGFSGHHWTSVGVNLLSFGLPLWGLSHVGIIGKCNTPERGLRLFDSAHGIGVRSQPLRAGIELYRGKAWLYRLARPLSLHECLRFTAHVNSMLGLPYDTSGAMRAGGLLWSIVQGALRGEGLASLFCSELVAEQLSYIGVFRTANVSRWNPNHLMRTLRRARVVCKPERIK